LDSIKLINTKGAHNKDHQPLFPNVDYDENFNKVGKFSRRGEAADHYSITRSPIKNNMNKKFTKCIVNGLPALILFYRSLGA
jgi:hypothetical protein